MREGNIVVLEGRLTADPKIYHTKSGKDIASFTIANNEVYKDAKGEKQVITNFVDVKAFRGAEYVKKMFKGNLVNVTGSLRQEDWNDKDGNKRSKLVIHASGFTNYSLIFGDGQAKEAPPAGLEEQEDKLPF